MHTFGLCTHVCITSKLCIALYTKSIMQVVEISQCSTHGEIWDVGLTITPFYMMLFLWVHCTSIWNPLYYMLLLFAINNVNLMGHCGYDLPLWVYGPASLGALLFPGAQRPLHHYLHHIDPRVNRALYFTWWDRLTGTYLDVHPKLHLS